MRVTDQAYVSAGGGASSYASLHAALRRQEAAQAAPSQAQDVATEASPADAEPSTSPLPSGISAAVLSGYVGNFYRVMEGVTSVLQDVELALPQIVVVGQESSGKSSVLESLAMMPLFPRKEDVCTRLPIHLKMRHVPKRDVVDGDQELMPHRRTPHSVDVAKHQIKMRLVYADDREPVVSEKELTAEQAAERMSEWMEMIVKEENEDKKLKGVVDHVLEIEVRSPHVPNLNLIDLPGIVAGRLIDEPDDMMQRTRALVEKYLQMPHTLVLAVVPAFERVRNSQAFQLVQQYDLMDSTIGVLTMADRSLDTSNPEGPLAEVMSRLDGTSRDIVYLKEGYVAVKNRDTRVSPEWSLDAFKTEENAWLEENLPGCIERKLASSSVLATKLEKMLADHVRATWVPQTLVRINKVKVEAEKKLIELGTDGQDIVDSFLKDASPTAGRHKMLELAKPILPGLLECVDTEMLQLAGLIHADFLHSREEHELILTPFGSKKLVGDSGSLLAASLVVLESQHSYMASHLSQILKNVALHIVGLIQKVIATSDKEMVKAHRLGRFGNLHLFFASVLWDRLNELLIDEEELLQRLEKSFVEFDPANVQILQIVSRTKTMSSEGAIGVKTLANNVELYLDSKGFQNTTLDELYIPLIESSSKIKSLDSAVARMIIGAISPTLAGKPTKGLNFQPASGYQESVNGSKAAPAKFQFGSTTAAPSGFGEVNSTIPPSPLLGGFGFGHTSNPLAPKEKEKPGKSSAGSDDGKFQDISEFGARLFFAITSHVVAPLLQPICDVGELDRKMREYVSRHPKVSASRMHIFHESTSGERKKLKMLVKRLDAAELGLQSTSNFQ
ncbi:hypothetical protein PHYBOEH_009011 [Phytophthora boehmeriae]|uniref:Dynamin-type G domain-containing protein n=1 Tax=Phytophthora boehmeriae TaxID=109152 RepID=A0A8T1W0K7_9STRA|nr:hypothetical protein PHYBOEH_009011 [Phytophthora boehmeriae]